MRPKTQKKIDALHEEIRTLVEKEKAHFRKVHPEVTGIHLQIAETQIEVAAWSPGLKRSYSIPSEMPSYVEYD
jgi:hypothetical protein